MFEFIDFLSSLKIRNSDCHLRIQVSSELENKFYGWYKKVVLYIENFIGLLHKYSTRVEFKYSYTTSFILSCRIGNFVITFEVSRVG